MDYQIIYFKTPAGEDAMAQRTRIVQRNLRNVLDLVDGKRNVGEIVKKFGDAAIGEAALADLERSGFIETAEGRRAREAAPPPPPRDATPSQPPGQPPAARKKGKKPDLKAEAFGEHFDDEDITVMDPLDFPNTSPPAQQDRDAPGKPPGKSVRRPPWEEDEELAELARGGAPPEYKPIFAEDAAGRGARADRVPAGPRGRRWFKFSLLALLLLLVAGAAFVSYYPYERSLPRVELKLRSAMGEPVRIGDLKFSLAPQPHITIERLRIGEDGALTAAVVRAVPLVGTLLGGRKDLSELQLHGVEMDIAALPRLAGWIKGGGPGEAYFTTQRLHFSELKLKLGELSLTGLSGEVLLDAQGGLASLRFATAGDAMTGELRPDGQAYRLRLDSGSWQVPGHDWLKLGTFEARGSLGVGGLRLDKFDARLFDGIVSGSAALDWTPGGRFEADLEIKRFDLAAVLKVLRPALGAQGELNARLHLAGDSAGLARGIAPVAVRGNFEVQRGVLSGFDFAEAVRSRGAGPTRGGETRFEQLTGEFLLDGADYRLGALSLGSGLMQANGALTLGPEQLSGHMSVVFRGASGMNASIAIDGRPGDPNLRRR